MATNACPLKVIINPSEEMQLRPGESELLRVVVTNYSQVGAIIEVSLDLPAQVRPWCKVARESFNLPGGGTQAVDFLWEIPVAVVPNSSEKRYYEYVLIVDDPTGRFLSAPLIFTQRLKILETARGGIDSNQDPTVLITPVTRSTQPTVAKPGAALVFQVEIHNRSRWVDEYRVTCPDLDANWYEIHYPEVFQTSGQIEAGTRMRLNPGTAGQASVEIQPPSTALAGNYSPTVRVYSAAHPDLLLQDILYLTIPPRYELSIELVAILDRVRQKAGQFQVRITNLGNTHRRLVLSAQTAEEDERCEYHLQATHLGVPPGRTQQVGLEVQPRDLNQQPVGIGRQLTFWVLVQDPDGYELPRNVPLKGSLYWEARSLGRQVLKLLAMGLGLVALVVLLGVMLSHLRPVPLGVESFKTTAQRYPYPGPVALEWVITNPRQLTEILIEGEAIEGRAKGGEPIVIRYEDFTPEGVPARSQNRCSSDGKVLICNFVSTEVRETGVYHFTLTIRGEGEVRSEPHTVPVEILSPPSPQIRRFFVPGNRRVYGAGEDIRLEWEMTHLDQVAGVQITSLSTGTVVQEYDADHLQAFLCESQAEKREVYACRGLVPQLEVGEYTLQLDLIPLDFRGEQASARVGPLVISQDLPRVESFTLNGSVTSPIAIEVGQTVVVRWHVAGDVKRVRISGVGQELPPEGQITLGPFVSERSIRVELKGIDSKGAVQVLSSLDLEVLAPETPEPSPPPSARPLSIPSSTYIPSAPRTGPSPVETPKVLISPMVPLQTPRPTPLPLFSQPGRPSPTEIPIPTIPIYDPPGEEGGI